MSWIQALTYEESSGKLRKLYDRVRGPDGRVDNILSLHSLRPHTLEGHMALYKCVLHHAANQIPPWFLEAVGVYVSHLNHCEYCVAHHHAGMAKRLDDEARAQEIFQALTDGSLEEAFPPREAAALRYVEELTISPSTVGEEAIITLRETGWSDGEILELNQVASYFAYANRTVSGLGGSTEGDTLGLTPDDSEDPENWSHR